MPDFWHQPHHLMRRLCLPLSLLYHALHRLRWMVRRPARLPVPVLCVGNLVAGGAGKTPTVLALVTLLQQHGRTPHVLSRGYGGSVRTATRVTTTHSAEEMGDEPLLLAQYAPCWVGRNRVATATCAIKAGADCLVMDDGFQNPSLHKDVSLLVIDGGYGIGNGAVMPAGPLRETVTSACQRAQAVLIIGRDVTGCLSRFPRNLHFLRGQITATIPETWQKHNTPLIAFCGIGRPAKFYDTLKAAALTLVATHDFPDHHPYRDADLQALYDEAQAHDATLITTEKDWMRLSEPWRARVHYVPITLDIQPRTTLEQLLTHHAILERAE
ncbi:MAG: tetraacyldisaccharide 4'-kinase [Sphaerospermopsis sp. SIO1G2]|nr:tetraacyldisaccharide 4'-kinase [Sphaerospermopsis sp. SIO1G2]